LFEGLEITEGKMDALVGRCYIGSTLVFSSVGNLAQGERVRRNLARHGRVPTVARHFSSCVLRQIFGLSPLFLGASPILHSNRTITYPGQDMAHRYNPLGDDALFCLRGAA